MKPVTRKRYTERIQIPSRQSCGLGKPVSTAAEELETGTSILYGWLRKHPQPGQIGSAGLGAVGEQPAADELPRLRRELANLKVENDILKKAAIILGTRPLPPGMR
jgi:transposase